LQFFWKIPVNQIGLLPGFFTLIILNPHFDETKIFPVVAPGQFARLVRRGGRKSAGHEHLHRRSLGPGF
jgi:hypothetical protein